MSSSEDSVLKPFLRGCGWVLLCFVGVFVGIPVASFLLLAGPYLAGYWLVDSHPDQAAYLAYPALAWIPFGAVVGWEKLRRERAERRAKRLAELYRAAQHRKMRLTGTGAPETGSPDPVDLKHAAYPERSCEACTSLRDRHAGPEA